MDIPLYQQLARHYLHAIRNGSLVQGSRMLSVRKLMQTHQVSLSTALQCCRHLEQQGWLVARERSGFYISQPVARQLAPATEPDTQTGTAQFVGIHEKVSQIIAAGQRKVRVNLARATAAAELYPHQALHKLALQQLRRDPTMLTRAITPTGRPELKTALAKRALDYGMSLVPEQLIITYGCMEALQLALRAVAQSGDVIAVETPTFYGLLQILESLGMRALEIPTSPAQGMSLEALQLALQHHPEIKAVVVVPHLQNPLGAMMPDAHKQALLNLCNEHQLALIEDDSYSGMVEGEIAPLAIKHWDKNGTVIYCASLHKVLAPGMRVGWMEAGRWHARVAMLKYAQTRYNEELSQIVCADYLTTPAYTRHLRKLRNQLAHCRQQAANKIADCFPANCRLSIPNGGASLWLELPAGINSRLVFELALQRGILISPGLMYANSARFDHCLRLNCSHPDSLEALQEIAGIVRHLADTV